MVMPDIMRDGIDRRRLMQMMAAGAVGAAATGGPARAAAAPYGSPQLFPGSRMPRVAMVIYPRMVLIDLIGPQTVFNLAGCEVHLVWKDRTPCSTDTGIPIMPTTTFDECPQDLDVLFIGGGIGGTIDCMKDMSVLDFLAGRAKTSTWVTSVCTGTMVLAAAGLLDGYKATGHWAIMHLLPIMGVTPVHERVVVDRNRVTGGGATAGIDYGLTLASLLRSEEAARRIQLLIEYAPRPPFDSGTPETAGSGMVEGIMAGRKEINATATRLAEAAAARFRKKA
ncbi:MAG: DJ-1/PfpI family protein [Steroidobacteraceae bacterium]